MIVAGSTHATARSQASRAAATSCPPSRAGRRPETARSRLTANQRGWAASRPVLAALLFFLEGLLGHRREPLEPRGSFFICFSVSPSLSDGEGRRGALRHCGPIGPILLAGARAGFVHWRGDCFRGPGSAGRPFIAASSDGGEVDATPATLAPVRLLFGPRPVRPTKIPSLLSPASLPAGSCCTCVAQ